MAKISRQIASMPLYTLEDTSDPNLKRCVDRYGDWTHYYVVDKKKYLPAVNHILGMGYAKGKRFYDYLLSVTKDEANKKLAAAGDEGRRTHLAIRDLIDGLRIKMTTKYPSETRDGRQEVLSPDEWDNLMGFQAFCDKYQPKVVSNEFAVYSLECGYAGSPDALLIVKVPQGDKVFPQSCAGKEVLFLPDWKTSQAIYPEYKAQVAAYHQAMKERGVFRKFENKYETFTGIVRIGTRHKSKFEVEVFDAGETKGNLDLFMSAKAIYQDQEPTWEPDTDTIPTEFFIKMPKAKVGRGSKKEKLA